MTRKTLRAVTDDEAPQATKSVTEAASVGTKRELLVAMRDRIAKAVEDSSTPPRDLGTLTKRLSDVVRELESLDAAAGHETGESDDVDDAEFDASAV